MYIYSKKKELVACIYKFRKKINNRINLSPENELLQASIIKFDKKFNLNRHIHTKVPRKTIGTQEIWIVMEGKLKATFYETDKTKICSKILKKGDISILFRGGHKFETLEKNTIIYEIKNGPYIKDKDLKKF
mgnify:FL=1